MKNFMTKKRIIITGLLLLVVGIAGLVFSVYSARSRAGQFDEQFAEYQQKHSTLDKFLDGSASFSDLTKTFNDDQWHTLLNAEGKEFVAEQWIIAASMIMITFGVLILIGMLLYRLIKTLSTGLVKSTGSVSVFTHCRWDRSGFVSMIKSLFAKKKTSELCWTGADLKKNSKHTEMLFADKPVVESREIVQSTEDTATIEQSEDVNETQVEAVGYQDTQTVEDPSPALIEPMSAMKDIREPVESQPDEDSELVINEPISVLKDLSEQVSAIREYATYQQGRMEKLEDGYDWSIIKTFCLRIIRCVDNLDMRIEKLSEQGQNTDDLTDIRDELLFSLESSGIEQFEPQLHSEYRGQEKKLEAVKDKISCDNDELKGKIAKIRKRGYYYMIEDDNVKVVRPSQVMLYA